MSDDYLVQRIARLIYGDSPDVSYVTAKTVIAIVRKEQADLIERQREALRVAQKALNIASRQLSEDHKSVLGGKAWGASALAAIDAALKEQ